MILILLCCAVSFLLVDRKNGCGIFLKRSLVEAGAVVKITLGTYLLGISQVFFYQVLLSQC